MKSPIDTYIANQGSQQKEVLKALRARLKDLLPEAEERMSYGVPSFRIDKISFLYAAFKYHVGIYPGPEVIEHFKSELSPYQTTKGTIKFQLDEPIPFDLIEKIVKVTFGE